KERLEDWSVNLRDIQAVKSRHQQAQELFVENDETGVPWHKDIMYPKNWPEISAKRKGAAEELEPEANRAARQKLSKRTPEFRFDAARLEEVIDSLRDLTGLNIEPNWDALEMAAIERDVEVTLRLRDVTFEKVLDLILSQVGAGETELAYEIDDGIIQISTKEDLSRLTVNRVYNVGDLLITVPTFRGRQIDLTQVGQTQQQGGLGGGRYARGGGGGGGGGGGEATSLAAAAAPMMRNSSIPAKTRLNRSSNSSSRPLTRKAGARRAATSDRSSPSTNN
ncbi:MAG: STN domain-containing protein, partial [Dehalococcoidia bacterium]